MPTFAFDARDASGRRQSGTLAADTSSAAATELRGRGWVVLDVSSEVAAATAASGAESYGLARFLPATRLDVELGFQQIASMLRSGVTLLSSLKTAADQARRPAMGKVWRQIAMRIETGSSFADALREHPRKFDDFCIQLARVGEQSGSLELVLSRAAEHLERMRNLRMTLINAMIYPLIVVIMAVGVSAFMVLGVIPKIEKFLAGRGRALPAMTQMLLDISHFCRDYLPHICVGVVVAGIAMLVFYKWPPGRVLVDRFLLRIPLIGGIVRTGGTALFARGLALLLSSGITLLESMATVERLVGNRAMSLHIRSVHESILRGGTLHEPLISGRVFQPMLGRMAAVGETTGTLDAVLDEVARFHEAQLAATVRRLSMLLEPAVILVVGSIVGFVYLAFFMALFSLAR